MAKYGSLEGKTSCFAMSDSSDRYKRSVTWSIYLTISELALIVTDDRFFETFRISLLFLLEQNQFRRDIHHFLANLIL